MYNYSLSLTSVLDGVGGQHHAPATLPPGNIWYPLYRRLGGPQGRSEQVRKISPPPEFDPRTVQPVAGRYTDWAIAARRIEIYICEKLVKASEFRGGNSEIFTLPIIQTDVRYLSANYFSDWPTSL